MGALWAAAKDTRPREQKWQLSPASIGVSHAAAIHGMPSQGWYIARWASKGALDGSSKLASFGCSSRGAHAPHICQLSSPTDPPIRSGRWPRRVPAAPAACPPPRAPAWLQSVSPSLASCAAPLMLLGGSEACCCSWRTTCAAPPALPACSHGVAAVLGLRRRKHAPRCR